MIIIITLFIIIIVIIIINYTFALRKKQINEYPHKQVDETGKQSKKIYRKKKKL